MIIWDYLCQLKEFTVGLFSRKSGGGEEEESSEDAKVFDAAGSRCVECFQPFPMAPIWSG